MSRQRGWEEGEELIYSLRDTKGVIVSSKAWDGVVHELAKKGLELEIGRVRKDQRRVVNKLGLGSLMRKKRKKKVIHNKLTTPSYSFFTSQDQIHNNEPFYEEGSDLERRMREKRVEEEFEREIKSTSSQDILWTLNH